MRILKEKHRILTKVTKNKLNKLAAPVLDSYSHPLANSALDTIKLLRSKAIT